VTLFDITERKKIEQAERQTKAALLQSEARIRKNEEHLRLAQQAARIGSFEWEIPQNVIEWSVELESLYGLSRAGFGGTYEAWQSLIHAEDRAYADERVQEAMVTGNFEAEWRVIWPDRTMHWLAARGQVFFGEDGKPKRLVGINMDVSVQKHAQEELQLASLVYRESAEAMMVTDEANRIVAVNPSFERITGFRSSEVVSDTPLILSSDDNNHASYRDMLERLETDHYWQGELWLKKKNGQKFAAAMTVNTTFHSNGAVNRHVTLFADVTEKKHAEEMVWQQANFDALTGLPNRRHFQDQLQQEVKHARRTGLPLALMFIDLDGFKDVNDTLGHDIGDLLLKLAAERLSSCVRETDTVGRLGGDEFTVLLSELHNVRQVSTRAQHILTRLEQPFQLGDEIAYVSGSIGITLYPQDATSMDELLVNADQAMYAAKHGGKNRYHYFTPALQEAAQERMWLANELRLAIDRKQFKLAFQPIVELASGCVNKAEALLRWEHPEKGAIDPSVFIPVAEETGLIREIGDWVFMEAANQVAKWRAAHHPDFQISINKSPVQFKARIGDLEPMFEYLHRLGLPGNAIAIEITEGLLMDESKVVADQLLAFRDAGIEVSLDDFGTGYSTLSYLKRFDIDRIKIDQSFVKDLEWNPNDFALCKAMIVMAHELGLKVVAEGVETEVQRSMLAEAGCDFVQGYLLSMPISADGLDTLLEQGALFCSEGPLPGKPSH
jgi:diguanylate cyclase (GGDEF)-like protein/PAS domain S-box-containing protein